MTTVWLVAGLGLLLVGGTALVSGAASVAGRLGVPPLVIGLTVLAFGTSSPELVVNIAGALDGETALAFGNVAGSNLSNLGLVLGLSALLSPVAIEGSLVRRELPLLLLGTLILLVMMLDGPLLGQPAVLNRSDGLILLLLFSIFVYMTIGQVIAQREDPLIDHVRALETHLEHHRGPSLRQGVGLIAFGLAALGVGGQMTITHGSALAAALGVSPVIIGMLIVGLGTSLPELVTSVIAALKREADLCVGNIIGSNIFNALVVLPASALIAPLPIPAGGIVDLLVSLLLAAVIIPLFYYRQGRLDRLAALLFIAIFVSYMTMRALG